MFTDRLQAGRKLAEALRHYKQKKCIVLALPRGGVPVGFEVVKALRCSLDTIVARKICAPGNPEFAVGAIAPGGVRVIDSWAGDVSVVVKEGTKEMERRIDIYKSGTFSGVENPEIVVVVDDGIATGKTAIAAIRAARAMYPSAHHVLAAPVAAPDSLAPLSQEADEVVVLEAPEGFVAVGESYASFPQLSDAEVIYFLKKARQLLVEK